MLCSSSKIKCISLSAIDKIVNSKSHLNRMVLSILIRPLILTFDISPTGNLFGCIVCFSIVLAVSDPFQRDTENHTPL